MDETKLDHISDQVTGALKEVRGGRDPDPDEINWAQELSQEQEKIRMLTGETVQNEETERQVLEEDAKEITDAMYAYTRENLKFTSVKRKDVANIETANESEYDTDDPDYILSEYDEEK